MGRDTIQLEDVVSTISGEYLLEFTSEYGIPEGLHPELPSPEETIVDFSEGKVGVYTKFFEFANYRIPLSQFLFDILGYYQIHLSQLSVIGAAKRIFPTVVAWRTSAPKDGMPPADSYSSVDVTTLNTRHTPIQKQPEVLLCLVGLSRNYFLGDDVYPTFLYDDDREMDLFNLISAPNPLKVKTGVRPRAAHEVPLLTVTASCVIEMEDTGVSLESLGTPSILEKSPLYFADEDPPQTITERVETEGQVQEELLWEILSVGHATTAEVMPETGLEEEVATIGPPMNKRRKQMRCKRVNDKAEANAPPKVLRKDHVYSPAHSAYGGKSLAVMGLGAGSISSTPAAQGTLTAAKSVSDPDPLSYAKLQPYPEQDIAQSSRGTATEIPTEYVATTEVNVQLSVGNLKLGKLTSVPSVVGSQGGIYQPGWGMTNDCRLDTPDAYQDMVDHIVPPGYFSKLRHLPNADFLSQYNINLARQVAMGSQLRLRFKQEVRLLKKARAKIARQDQRIQVRDKEIKKLDQEIQSLRSVDAEVHGLHNQTKNLKTLLEAGADMKTAAEAKNVELDKELDSLRVQFSDLQVSNDQLSQQVSNLQAQVTGEERIKVAFEEFKKCEDDRVEQRCAEMDARLDALSIDFDEELYPHMLTAIAGRRWVIEHGLRLAVLKCAESMELRQAFADVVSAGIAKAAIEAYDPEAETKYVAALHALKNLKYPLVDQLEKLKDAPIDLIMASLYLESDSGEDAPQWIRELRPSSSQLKIPVYPEKKKKCRVVCRTHGVGSAYHARSDGIPVSVPTVVPQGLAILLVDAATQTEISEASLRLLRSKSLPPMYNLVWS
ncbi:hypothetical protein Tco_0991452 [Tanacetum coccineum]|uniref:Transposase (Putative), gypsy type n=1 Tax=Tanacetum coccineum TaxID=301880 RepID=A0ABQ5EZA4_9ASTR